MNTEPKEAADQKNSESDPESWQKFKDLAKQVLTIPPEEAAKIRAKDPPDKEENS